MAKTDSLSKALERKYFNNGKCVMNHLKAFNKGKEPNWPHLKKLFLIRFVKYLDSVVSANSARLYCAYLKSIINDYSEEVMVPCKDFASILSLKKIQSLSVYNTDEEIKKLIEYIPASQKEHTVRNQYVLSCLTGMRHSDIIKADKENITESGIFHLSRKTKTLVHGYACGVIEQYLAEGMDKLYSDPTFNNTIRSICRQTGITETVKVIKAGKEITGEKCDMISSHTARRSFATNMYKQTKDLYLVSRLMGHSNIEVTQGYICIDIKENEQVIEYYRQYDFVK